MSEYAMEYKTIDGFKGTLPKYVRHLVDKRFNDLEEKYCKVLSELEELKAENRSRKFKEGVE
jgi:hypothetical protein